MVEVNLNPTRRDVAVFGLLWMLFFGAIGALTYRKPEALAGAAAFLAVAWSISLIFNGSSSRVIQLAGVFLPAIFAGFWGARRLGGQPIAAAAVAGGIGLVGALAIWAVPALGRRAYIGWMIAAVPVGWTVSHLVLAAVYYLVLTPIGLAMRLLGHDPMRRRPDPASETYWIERPAAAKPERYFRQF